MTLASLPRFCFAERVTTASLLSLCCAQMEKSYGFHAWVVLDLIWLTTPSCKTLWRKIIWVQSTVTQNPYTFCVGHSLQEKQGEGFWWKEKKILFGSSVIWVTYCLHFSYSSSLSSICLSLPVAIRHISSRTNNPFLDRTYTAQWMNQHFSALMALLRSPKPGAGGNSSVPFELPSSPVIVLRQLHTLGLLHLYFWLSLTASWRESTNHFVLYSSFLSLCLFEW